MFAAWSWLAEAGLRDGAEGGSVPVGVCSLFWRGCIQIPEFEILVFYGLKETCNFGGDFGPTYLHYRSQNLAYTSVWDAISFFQSTSTLLYCTYTGSLDGHIYPGPPGWIPSPEFLSLSTSIPELAWGLWKGKRARLGRERRSGLDTTLGQ
ncbi:hypothetical protein CONLIGDRAFT_386837 [Coniochaeta ligniaria NRRL 30616]|uniref:Uncharacterized protein n=1 Tax=Coniochaeta ligniaria NRRL 30616 TaxID=1408157 RepID=A0A1J7J5K3_9PEZI|nr:hypothetical protein CONLIGDRAFT_386837 [Coniochaeta ligniaria NRRL 30616]